ncbi:MAG: histidine phosphatase family protein [Candidatus Cryosericum sp.]|nr:histidine phosphatase family protein [bacterium]
MKTVYLVRHAETAWNVAGKVQGALDIPLSPTGVVQTRKTIAFLSTVRFDAVFTSPLARARAIAEPVGQTLGIPAIVVPDLQEINFGGWEGHTLNEVEVLYPDTFAAWKLKLPEAQPDGGESLLQAGIRARNVRSLLESHPGRLILVVAHGGINRILISTLLDLPASAYSDFEQLNAGISVLTMEDKTWRALSMDSTSHLV